jgi:ketosteroid isomerase-like protein
MNRQKLRLGLLQAAIAIAMLIGAVAPALGSGQTKIVSMTRSMAVFLTLERDLANAVASHDQGTTDALLAEEFELRLASNPTEPTVREDWLQLASSGIVGNIEQLSVHDHGDLAIASFIKSIPANADKSRLLRTYIIDVWRKQGESWQLITRYQSELPTAEAPTEDVAPTGKG